jgi:transcription elongation factor Elf1
MPHQGLDASRSSWARQELRWETRLQSFDCPVCGAEDGDSCVVAGMEQFRCGEGAHEARVAISAGLW